MSDYNFNLINTVRSEFVKYGNIENLKNFCKSHPTYNSPSSGCFTRERTLSFRKLLSFLLYPRSKSTEIELLEYSHLIGRPNVNKSDFSRRRRLIPADYLKAMSRDIVCGFYDSSSRVMKWHGHLLLAADGTTYSLPNTPQVKKMYLQGRKTGRSEQALARGVVLKDVLNDTIIASNMECYGKDEIRLLLDEINALPDSLLTMQPVVILDRKYCAYTLIEPLMRKNIGFIIRVKERFNKDVDSFIASGEICRDATLTPASTSIKKLKRLYGKDAAGQFPVRLVRLSDNVVVMTTIKDESLFQPQGDIYRLRWNVETTIGFVKNNLQVEIFSSYLNNSMRQDFHARTIQYNLLSLLCHQAAELRHDDNDRRINRNVALGILKLEFGIFINDLSDSFYHSLTRLLNLILRFTTRVKPNRHNPRLFRKIKHSGKFITLHNYREAI